MIHDRRVVSIIPARGGSKGIPRKNLRVVAGKPLIEWTINSSTATSLVDATYVSTEDPEIREVAEGYGASIIVRPPELAEDDTPGVAPLVHAVSEVCNPEDVVVYLQPTSPLRTSIHVEEAVATYFQAKADVCVSVRPVTELPHWMYALDDDLLMAPFLSMELPVRRQDVSHLRILNGAIYVASAAHILKEQSLSKGRLYGYLMDHESSVDIDSELDLVLAEVLLNQRLSR